MGITQQDIADALYISLITVVVYQNPTLQGCHAMRIMENLLESGHPPEVRQINYKNHYMFARMIE